MKLSEDDILRISTALLSIASEYRQSGNPQLQTEATFVEALFDRIIKCDEIHINETWRRTSERPAA